MKQLRIHDETVERIRHYQAFLKTNPQPKWTEEIMDFVAEVSYIAGKQYEDHFNELFQEKKPNE